MSFDFNDGMATSRGFDLLRGVSHNVSQVFGNHGSIMIALCKVINSRYFIMYHRRLRDLQERSQETLPARSQTYLTLSPRSKHERVHGNRGVCH